MKSNLMRLAMVMGLVVAAEGYCHAGVWSKAIREAIEAVAKRSGKLAREGVEEGAERAASRRALREGLEVATGKAGRLSGALVARYGDDVARPVISNFGDDGARALGSLTPVGAKRLATMADELAAGGRGGDWMRLIAQRGDEVTDWLWRRRGAVAVGTVATAVLLEPEEFIKATERVAAPFAERAAAAVPWAALWTVALLCGGIWLVTKRKLAWWRWE
jgi:hypothetical protein